jgi:hypothetical protein
MLNTPERRKQRNVTLGRLLLIGVLLTTSCAVPSPTCGERRDGQGPPQITNREQEMCEIARRRVLQYLRTADPVTPQMLDDWRQAAARWKRASSLEALLEGVGSTVGAGLAASIATGVEQVRERSRKPIGADGDPELALIRAAAHGIALAFDQVQVADDPSDLERAAESTLPDELTD